MMNSTIAGLRVVKTGDATTHHDLPSSTRAARSRYEAGLRHIELQRLARSIPVPTDDKEVKIRLRRLGQPITLFGEGAPDRRERLRSLYSQMAIAGKLEEFLAEDNRELEEKQRREREEEEAELARAKEEQYLAEGPAVLKDVRRYITEYSLTAARSRLEREKEQRARLGLDEEWLRRRREGHKAHFSELEEGESQASMDIQKNGPIDVNLLSKQSWKVPKDFHGDQGKRIYRPAETAYYRNEYQTDYTSAVKQLRHVSNKGSQVGDTRALSACAFSPDGAVVATGSWTGLTKLWDAEHYGAVAKLRGHTCRVTDVAFHPRATGGPVAGVGRRGGPRQAENEVNIATVGADGWLCLWPVNYPLTSSSSSSLLASSFSSEGTKGEFVSPTSTTSSSSSSSPLLPSTGNMDDNEGSSTSSTSSSSSSNSSRGDSSSLMGDVLAESIPEVTVPTLTPLAILKGHTDRCSRVAWHPSGDYIFTTGFDATIRMWDATTQKPIYTQPGHSSAVYALAVHPDGSLLATGDLGGICRIWDLRTGRSLMALEGHARQVSQFYFLYTTHLHSH